MVELLKIKCECGHLNVIPVHGKISTVKTTVKCEECGKVLVVKE